jgi:hypothetical protein
MIRHTLAVALLGIGIGFAGHAPVHAAPLPSGVAASSMRVADEMVVTVGGRCWELPPVASNIYLFFALAADAEIDYHCDNRSDDDHYDRHTYDERKEPSYKDGGYAQPKDLKGAPR